MSFFKFSKEYTSSFGFKVRTLNIERIYSTSDSDLSISLIDGDHISIDKKDYIALDEYLLYESDSESGSDADSESESDGGREEASDADSESESEDELEDEMESLNINNKYIPKFFRWVI